MCSHFSLCYWFNLDQILSYMLLFHLLVILIIPLLWRRGYSILVLSVLSSVTIIFHHTFLSNHTLQPLQTWYGATISFNISQTAWPIWTKLGRNVPEEVFFKRCSQNLIPSKTLVAMATKLNFLSNSLKIFSGFWVQFWNNFTGMFLLWPFSKSVREIFICP